MSGVAVVTGGTRGIGAAVSQAFYQEGYQVAAIYHGNVEKAQDFEKKTGISVFRWDVSDFEACQTGVAEIQNKLGPVDVLINNAGITRDASFHKMTLEAWQDVIQTNLSSVFCMTRAVVDGMRAQQAGRIINMSSINALKGQRGQTNYSASKAGILGFTKSLAQELASFGVTVNAIAPGYINTEMVQAMPAPILEKIIGEIPLKRLGAPQEVARLALFLASSEAAFITGSTFNINGGQVMI